MRKLALALVACLTIGAAPVAQAATISQVDGGETSVLFTFGLLESLGLEVVDTSGGTFVPGDLGPFSVGFEISEERSTASYDANDVLGTLGGAVEHNGTISLDDPDTPTEAVQVGNFTVDLTTLQVIDNADLAGTPLFNLANPIIEAYPTSLVIAADILVSQEFSDLLLALGLTEGDITGADAGMALVVADASVIPVPAAVWLFASALGLLGWVRTRVAA